MGALSSSAPVEESAGSPWGGGGGWSSLEAFMGPAENSNHEEQDRKEQGVSENEIVDGLGR